VVSRWYDQSGQSNHAVQDTPGLQPQIYDGTAVITDNGKPALSCDLDHFELGSTISLTSGYSAIHVSQQSTRDSSSFGSSFTFNYVTLYQSSNVWFYHNTAGVTIPYIVPLNTQQLHWLNWTGSTVGIGVNGGTLSTGALSASASIDRLLNAAGNTRAGWTGLVQEMIVYPLDKNAAGERSAIETNINDYYYAYNTSGFVVDYPGAIAAYSVRQLGDRQRYAMRVRRLGGAADYLDVGFVAGELDTQAIIDFGGSDTLGVEVWYDQSRSGNDVTNTDTTTMPIIYNGSSVITDGGKPALGRNSAGLYYILTNIIPAGVTQASFIAVTQGPDAGTLVRTWYGSGGGSLNSLTTGNNLYVYNGGSPQFGSGSAVGRTLGIQLNDSNAGAAEKGWRNGVLNYSADSGPNSPSTNALGSASLASSPLFMQEMILYPSDIDAGGTRINIETNIMTYYGIP